MIDVPITHRHLDVGEVRLHVAEAGAGPLVVLLHGFPDFWYSWRRQIPALAAAGYRVVAPDLRGYNASDRPGPASRYRIERLVGDIAGLIRACGEEQAAAVVGHDWGGAVAWGLAQRRASLLERLVILNCPHPGTFAAALRSPRQLARSWYMFFFQLPLLPEQVLRLGDHALLRRLLRAAATDPEAFSEADLRRHTEAARRSGGLGGGIDYYRAMGRALLRRGGRMPTTTTGRVEVPVLVLWGERDPVLLPELADPPPQMVTNAKVVRIPDAGHWVHLDAAEQVNDELLRFLKSS